MTARKRKQPEKKKKPARRGPHPAMVALSLAGRVAARHPRAFGGSAAFAIVFSFVAANAMWYQPGAHPSPFLRTRLPLDQAEAARREKDGLQPRKVTTFVIEREDETRTASVEQQEPDPARAPAQVKTLPRPTVPADAGAVVEIQKELARRGLYDGPADGKTGPKTSAAIARFEQQSGREATGVPTDELLAALREGNGGGAATPAERPYESVKGGKGELDPVAAAIRNAEIDPEFVPKADIPSSSELVMNIQKGLTNLAYAEVSVDGVAGAQTRAAIRHFEKHYRLPETGEPSAKVLKKMKDIGAL